MWEKLLAFTEKTRRLKLADSKASLSILLMMITDCHKNYEYIYFNVTIRFRALGGTPREYPVADCLLYSHHLSS